MNMGKVFSETKRKDYRSGGNLSVWSFFFSQIFLRKEVIIGTQILFARSYILTV